MPFAKSTNCITLANLKRKQRRGLWKQHELFAFVIQKETYILKKKTIWGGGALETP